MRINEYNFRPTCLGGPCRFSVIVWHIVAAACQIVRAHFSLRGAFLLLVLWGYSTCFHWSSNLRDWAIAYSGAHPRVPSKEVLVLSVYEQVAGSRLNFCFGLDFILNRFYGQALSVVIGGNNKTIRYYSLTLNP